MLEELRDALDNLVKTNSTLVSTDDRLYEFLIDFLHGEQCAIDVVPVVDNIVCITILV